MGGNSHDGHWNHPQRSHRKEKTPESDQDWEDHEDDTRENSLHKGRARLDERLAQNHSTRGEETMLDNDEEENSKMLLNLGDTVSFQYDLGDYLHDDPELSLDPLHSRELYKADTQNIFLLLCQKAKDPTSWVDPKKLPSMFRFALRRPLMPERELHWNLEDVGIDPFLGFLDCISNTSEGSPLRPRQILKGILYSEEGRAHVSRRYERLPKGLSLLTKCVDDTDAADDEPTHQDEMTAELWTVFNNVEARKIRLEDAPTRYRDILSAFDCNNDELAEWLEDLEIPSDHVDHGSHRAELSKGPGSPRVATSPMLVKEIAGLVRLYRSNEIQLEDFLSLLREIRDGSTFEEDVMMEYVRNSSYNAEAVAGLLLVESDSTSSSGSDCAIAAEEEPSRYPLATSNPGKSTLGDSINQDLKEEFAAIYRDVLCSQMPFDNALLRFRKLLGDPDMSNAVLSKNLVAYNVPPDLFFGGENLSETPPKLDGNVEEAQITRFKKPRITLRLPARFSSPTSARDLNSTSAASSSVSTHCGTADVGFTEEEVPQMPRHDDHDATLETRAATAPSAILQSSPRKPSAAASSEGVSSAEQQSPVAQAKQPPERRRKDGSCQTGLATLLAQETHSMGLEKSGNLQDLVSTGISTDITEPDPEPAVTEFAHSVEPPTFVQPLPCNRPDRCKQSTKAKPEPPKPRAGTPMPGVSLPLSVLAQRRSESAGIEWKRYVGCSVGNPSEEMYDCSRLSISPEKGTSVDLFGLPIPTEDARDLAKAMHLPPDFAEARIRSRTPRRVKSKMFKKATANVTLPSPKRKSSANSEAGHRKMRKQKATESDVFAAEGQDHDDFIRSLFNPFILSQSGIACGWCLEMKCLCGRSKETTDDEASKNPSSSPMERNSRPLLLEQPSFPVAKSEHTSTSDPSQHPAEKPGKACVSGTLRTDEAVNAAPALTSIAKKYRITLDTLTGVEKERKSDDQSAGYLLARDETTSGRTEHVEFSSQDDCPTIKGVNSSSEASGQWSSGRGKETAPSPTPKLTSREFSPLPGVRHIMVDDVGLISPNSRGSSFSIEPKGLGLVDQSDQDEIAAPDELMTPLSRCPSSSSRSALLESSAQAQSDDIELADAAMPLLSRCPFRSSEPARLESSTKTKARETAVQNELMPSLLPCSPPTPRLRTLELPSRVMDSSCSTEERQAEQAGSGAFHQRRASIGAASGNGTPSVSAKELKAQRRRYKLFDRNRRARQAMSYAEALDQVLEEGRCEHKSYFVVMAELRHKRIQANLQARQYRFFQSSNNLSGPSGQTVALSKLFDKYRGSRTPSKTLLPIYWLTSIALGADEAIESPDTIGVEGSMKYLGDLGVNLDEVVVLAVLAELQAPTMGEFSREGFIQGWKTYRHYPLPQTVSPSPPSSPQNADHSHSHRSADTLSKQQALVPQFRRHLLTAPDFFKRTYKHTFLIARTPGQKSVALDTAIEYWRLLFSAPSLAWHSRSTPWLEWWIEYLEGRWKKSVNRDMWDQTGVFVTRCLSDESMGWWSEDGAWPGVLDEFVGFVREKREGGEGARMETE